MQHFKDILYVLHQNPLQRAALVAFIIKFTAELQPAPGLANEAMTASRTTLPSTSIASSTTASLTDGHGTTDKASEPVAELVDKPSKPRKATTGNKRVVPDELEDEGNVQIQASSILKRRRITPKVNKPLKTKDLLKTPEQMGKVSVAMSRTHTADKIQANRTKFYRRLLQIAKPRGIRTKDRAGQQPDKLFDIATATQLTNFLFENMMGKSAMAQLIQFVDEYKPGLSAGNLDTAAFEGPDPATYDLKASTHLVDFGTALWIEMTHKYDESILGHVRTVTQAFNTYSAYLQVKNLDDGDIKEQWDLIKSQSDAQRKADIEENAHETTSRGVSHATMALELMVVFTGIDKTTINNKINRSRHFHMLLDKLGTGLLLLLPWGSVDFLKTMGVGRLESACNLLLKCCPYVVELGELLEKYIWQPFREGARELPVDVSYLETAEGETRFLDQLRAAIENYQSKH